MIHELDRVVLVDDLMDYSLKAGDIGVVMLVHGDHEGYEVEFVALDGTTIAVATVFAAQVRPIQRGEIAHARALHSA